MGRAAPRRRRPRDGKRGRPTAGAPETVVLRAAAGSLNGRIIRIDYDLTISSPSASAVTDIGPETAAMSQYAIACGDLTVVPGHTVRLVGSASHPVRWMVIVMDETPVFEGDRYRSSSTPRAWTGRWFSIPRSAVTACANQLVNPTRVTASFELSTPAAAGSSAG